MERVAGALGHARRLVVGESPRGDVDRTRLVVGERHTTPPIRAESRPAAQAPRRPWPTRTPATSGRREPLRLECPARCQLASTGWAKRSARDERFGERVGTPAVGAGEVAPASTGAAGRTAAKEESSPGSGSGVGEAWRRPAAPGAEHPPHRLADVSAQRLGRTAADGPRRAVTVRSWPPPTG